MNNKDPIGLNKIKNSVYDEIGLKHLIKSSNISAWHGETKIIDEANERFFLQDLTEYQIVWYLSDLFFWIIYFGAFISTQSDLMTTSDSKHECFNSNTSNKKKYFHQNFFSYFKEFFISFLVVFEDFEHFIRVCLKNYRVYSIFKSILNTKILFRILFVICLSGAFLKFYSNLMATVYSILKLTIIEDSFKKYLKINLES